MNFNLSEATAILGKTPDALISLLSELPNKWTSANEGPDTWSAFDIVGHLVHGEKTDWIARVKIILEQGEKNTFEPFDRFAQLKDSEGKTMKDLLTEFKILRQQNLKIIQSLDINTKHLLLKGIHPALGEVSLQNLLATWVAHDMNHLAQISRVLGKQYKDEVGPWKEFLRIMH